MAKKTKPRKTTTKKTASKKARTKVSKPAARKAVPKTERPNRVFAIRVTDAELAAIHKAAGVRNATRFMRAVAAAFAGTDTKAFQAVLAEAKQARAAKPRRQRFRPD